MFFIFRHSLLGTSLSTKAFEDIGMKFKDFSDDQEYEKTRERVIRKLITTPALKVFIPLIHLL